jgi:Tol biopolymer transport system component
MKLSRYLQICLIGTFGCLSLLGQPLVEIATAPGNTSASASDVSFLSNLSPDGRYILFLSSARDLVTNDDLAGWANVYQFDRASGENILVSVNAAGLGGGNRHSAMAAASTNGVVAFVSAASNLIANDTNASEDIFARDLNSGLTRLITVAQNGGVPTNPPLSRNQPLSGNPLISHDGRFVAFESRATDLVSVADTNTTHDVFVYDLQSSSMQLVSINTNGTAANGRSRLGAMTPDGRKIAFISSATDLVLNGPTNGNEELYVRDLVSGETTCLSAGLELEVSYPPGPAPSSVYRCFYPALSADGAAVIFKAAAPGAASASVITFRNGTRSTITNNADLRSAPQISADAKWIVYDAGGHIYRNFDLVTTGLAPSGENGSTAASPTMSADGQKIAFLVFSNTGPVQAYVRDMSEPSIRLVTVTSAGAPSPRSHALAGVIMDPVGSFVAFDSTDSALVTNDSNAASDVFVRDLARSETTLASGRGSALLPNTARGGVSVSRFSLSADGGKLVFTSLDSDLVPGDTNGRPDVFVRDLMSGGIASLSDSNGVFWTNWGGLDPMISANGGYATFTRDRSTLIRKDLQSGAAAIVWNVTRVSTTARRQLYSPLSADGRLVVYKDDFGTWVQDVSAGTNRNIGPAGPATSVPVLSPDDSSVLYSDSGSRVTLHTLATGSNEVVAPGPAEYTFSANSRYVLVAGASISRYDRMSRSNLVVCTSCTNPSISGDGRLVVYERGPLTSRSIELRDLEANTTTLISQNAHGVNGNGRSTSPVISGDGAFVVFVSRASDLAPGDINGTADIFVRDLRLNKTVRIIGELPDGAMGAGPASTPVLAADGRTLAFQSFSARMAANDFDQNGDIFVLRLGGGDSDNDALPDDWEVAYFGNLDQPASGDFDHDGHTNAQEYTAGTDPTNQNSVLRVLTLLSSTTGQTQLFWSAIPGKTYRVEFKASLNDSQWTSFPDLVTASGTTASATDANSGFGAARFYRVVVVN